MTAPMKKRRFQKTTHVKRSFVGLTAAPTARVRPRSRGKSRGPVVHTTTSGLCGFGGSATTMASPGRSVPPRRTTPMIPALRSRPAFRGLAEHGLGPGPCRGCRSSCRDRGCRKSRPGPRRCGRSPPSAWQRGRDLMSARSRPSRRAPARSRARPSRRRVREAGNAPAARFGASASNLMR